MLLPHACYRPNAFKLTVGNDRQCNIWNMHFFGACGYSGYSGIVAMSCHAFAVMPHMVCSCKFVMSLYLSSLLTSILMLRFSQLLKISLSKPSSTCRILLWCHQHCMFVVRSLCPYLSVLKIHSSGFTSIIFALFYSNRAGNRKKRLHCAAWWASCPFTFA